MDLIIVHQSISKYHRRDEEEVNLANHSSFEAWVNVLAMCANERSRIIEISGIKRRFCHGSRFLHCQYSN